MLCGEGTGNPLQYSCPETPMEREALWWLSPLCLVWLVQHLSVQLPSLGTDASRGRHSHQLQLRRVLWAVTLGDPESNNPEFTARLLSPCDLRHLIYLSNPSFLTCKMGIAGTPLS